MSARYRRVCLEAVGYALPEEVVSSAEIEARLEPLYTRLKLPAGRLELMTGIQTRRFWRPETLSGTVSQRSAAAALEVSGLARDRVGLLIHASVCRDHLEPATACRVHHGLGLPASALVFDLSNACLGILCGMHLAASMIEQGQIQAALVVGTEGSRQVVENTITWLNNNLALDRQSVKLAVASLTLGSASAAVLLVEESLSQTGNRLHCGQWLAATDHHELCKSGRDEAMADGMRPLMTTDSEQLLLQGVAAGKRAFEQFLQVADWQRPQLTRTVCHQVGAAHRKLMLEALELDPLRDFVTFAELGNTGAAAVPVTLAKACEAQAVDSGPVALLGIGSGINVMMLGVDWRRSLVAEASSQGL